MVYTKTIIHLSVGESGGYLPPLRLITVNYSRIMIASRLWTDARLTSSLQGFSLRVLEWRKGLRI